MGEGDPVGVEGADVTAISPSFAPIPGFAGTSPMRGKEDFSA